MLTPQRAGTGDLKALPKFHALRSNPEIADMERALAFSPQNLALLTSLADALFGDGCFEEATSLYEQILTRGGDPIPAYMGLGWIAFARGNEEASRFHLARAHECLCVASAADPNNLDILTRLAATLRGLNRAEEAAPIYEKVLAINPKHVSSLMGLGWIALGDGKDDVALARFQAAAELDPTSPHVQLGLSKVHMQMNRLTDAEMILRRLINQAPNHAQAHASLGALARKRHDWSGAVGEFQAAIHSDPKNIRFRMDLAQTFCDVLRWEDAEQTYRSVLEHSAGNPQALMGLARVAEGRGDVAAALRWFEEAAVAAPLDLRPKQQLRRLRVTPEAHDWRREVEEAVAASRAADVSLEAQLEAGRVLVAYGLTALARPLLQRLQAVFPDARQLLLAVRQIERMGLARPLPACASGSDGAEGQFEFLQGFLEMPVPGSDTVVIVFGGTHHRLWIAFSLLHEILRRTGVSVIYCRDLQRLWYEAGIIGLGEDFASTLQGFRALIRRYGATRVLTLGNCMGCLGALRHGLLLGAQGVLALSPKLRLLADPEPPQERHRFKPLAENRCATHRNIRREYLEAPSRPKVTLVFGEDCAEDSDDAHAMANVGGVTLAGIPESSDTNSVKDLIVRGLFEPLLRDFIAAGALSQKVHKLISASQIPRTRTLQRSGSL